MVVDVAAVADVVFETVDGEVQAAGFVGFADGGDPVHGLAGIVFRTFAEVTSEMAIPPRYTFTEYSGHAEAFFQDPYQTFRVSGPTPEASNGPEDALASFLFLPK